MLNLCSVFLSFAINLSIIFEYFAVVQMWYLSLNAMQSILDIQTDVSKTEFCPMKGIQQENLLL